MNLNSKEAYPTIHDLIFNMYDEDITEEESELIFLAVDTEADFTWDTDQRDILLDDLCNLFDQTLPWPNYGSSAEYKIAFAKDLVKSKNNFLTLIERK